MPIYTFYPCRTDGSSPTFEAFDLAGDDEVLGRANLMLDEHDSCAFVTVWQGDREAMSRAATLHAHQFSWDRSMEALDRIYGELLGRVRRAATGARLREGAFPQAA